MSIFTTINGEYHPPSRLSLDGKEDSHSEIFYNRNQTPKVHEKNWGHFNRESPRATLIDEALKIDDFFSLSIVPTDPTVRQTWYVRKSPRVEGAEVYTQKVFSTEYTPEVYVAPIVHQDFVKPYSQYNCDRLPGWEAKGVIIQLSDKENELNPSEISRLGKKISDVFLRFTEDTGAKELVLTRIEEGQMKQLHFIKPPLISGSRQ